MFRNNVIDYNLWARYRNLVRNEPSYVYKSYISLYQTKNTQRFNARHLLILNEDAYLPTPHL